MPFKRDQRKTCHTCYAVFWVETNRAHTAKYCSPGCKYLAQRGKGSYNWKEPDGKCNQCQEPFKIKYKGARFCSRTCYVNWAYEQKLCKDCGNKRCTLHDKIRQQRWRAAATKQELKAKSMQVAYRSGTNRTRTLTLDEARALISNPPICIYCEQPVPWYALSIDHKQPVSRGGNHDPENLVWVDLSCNLVKGSMTAEEYINFLAFIRRYPEVEQYIIPRLKMGGGAIYGRRHNG